MTVVAMVISDISGGVLTYQRGVESFRQFRVV